MKVHGCAFGGTGDVENHNYCYKPTYAYKFDKAFIDSHLLSEESEENACLTGEEVCEGQGLDETACGSNSCCG